MFTVLFSTTSEDKEFQQFTHLFEKEYLLESSLHFFNIILKLWPRVATLPGVTVKKKQNSLSLLIYE